MGTVDSVEDLNFRTSVVHKTSKEGHCCHFGLFMCKEVG